MGVNFPDMIYNSIILISVFNFVYMYTIPVFTHIYNLKFVFPIGFIKLTDHYLNLHIPGQPKRNEILNCYSSILHASILLVSSILYVYHFIGLETYQIALNYSIVYNTLDIFTVINSNSRIKIQLICHHIMVVVSMTIPYITPIPDNYYYYIALNLFSETTTVPLNLSWILYIQNKTNTPIYKFYMISTLVLYLPFRVLLNTYIFYDMYYNMDSMFKYCEVLIMVLNYFWFYKLCRKAYSISLN